MTPEEISKMSPDELRRASAERMIEMCRLFPDKVLVRAIVDPDGEFVGSKWELTDQGRESWRRAARFVLAERGREID